MPQKWAQGEMSVDSAQLPLTYLRLSSALPLPYPSFNPNRSLGCYALTSILFVIYSAASRLQWTSTSSLKASKYLLKNTSHYHHNANDRFGLNKG